jgi:hypothetical protein
LACSSPDARRYVRQLLATLAESDFCKTVSLPFGDPSTWDVYAVSNDEGDWYVKLNMQNNQVIVASCHPPEHVLKRKDGTCIKPQT